MPRIVFQRLERAPPSQGHAHSADNPPLSQPPGAPCWQVTQTWVLGAWSACLSPLRWPAETKVAWCLWIKWEWGHKQRASGSAPAERNEAQGPWGEGGESGVYLGAVYLLFLMGSWGGEFWTLWRIWWICGPSSQKSVHVRAPQAHPCSCSGLTGPWTQPTGPVFVSCFTSVHCADRILNMDKKEKNLRI